MGLPAEQFDGPLTIIDRAGHCHTPTMNFTTHAGAQDHLPRIDHRKEASAMSIRPIAELYSNPDHDGNTVPLAKGRIARAKAAYTTRRVDLAVATCLLTGDIQPRAGDLVLARIERLRQHKRIELVNGRRAHLHVGDEVILAYAARYAPDQFESYVPVDLGPCDLVASGGVASECRSKHSGMKNPTRIQPVGLLADQQGRRINMIEWSLPEQATPGYTPKTVAVLGTMMNAGKTTCAANLVRGCKNSGLKVGALKVTGTGSGCDRWVLTDAGADLVLDFTDAGEPSTFGLSPQRVEEIFATLTNYLAHQDLDVIVMEVADGIYQHETAALLGSRAFQKRCDGVMFAAGDGCGVLAGVRHLEEMGYEVLAVSGTLTASPLAVQEARQVVSVPVVTQDDLSTGRWQPPVGIASREGGPVAIERSYPPSDTGGQDYSPRFVKWLDGSHIAGFGS